MTFVEALEAVEMKLERRLDNDEISALGALLESGKPIEEIINVLEVPVVVPTDETEVKTYLYEASGDGVIPIPEVSQD